MGIEHNKIPPTAKVPRELCAEILRKAENGTLTTTEELMGYSIGSAIVARANEIEPPEVIELPQKQNIAAPEILKGRLRKGLA